MDEDKDSDAAIQLGGFALSEVLNSLGLEADTDNLNQLGVATKSKTKVDISKDSIYKGKFVDDAEGEGDDLEAQVDQEMYDEKYSKPAAMAAKSGGGTQLLRGEEDDFDEDSEEEGGGGDVKMVKEEPREDDDDLFGASPEAESAPPPSAPSTSITAPRFGLSLQSGSPKAGLIPSSASVGAEEAHHVDEEAIIVPPPPMKTKDVASLFPGYKKGQVLDFTDLFATRPRKRVKKNVQPPRLDLLTLDQVRKARSTKDALLAPLRSRPEAVNVYRSLLQEVAVRKREAWEDEGSSDEELLKALHNTNLTTRAKWNVPADVDIGFEAIELDDWEARIIWGDPHEPPEEGSTETLNPLAPRNAEFEKGDWLKSIIWEQNTTYRPFAGIELNLNDPGMLLEQHAFLEPSPAAAAQVIKVASGGADMFNLSNDKEYEVAKEAKKRIRQTFGLLEVQHAWPAQKLQLPFYKTRLTKSDARSFHRPPIQFPANIQLSFTKVRSSKKKKDKMGRKIRKGDGESFRTTGDLSLRDTSPFLLWEYSEENPPIISNLGMGSTLVNYYRKLNPDDDFVPQLDVGEPFLLEENDESPFKSFGSVEPGQTVPTLYNNLVRAPIFRHKPYQTDFLLVRTTINGEVKYYIREIKTMFVIGQTYPLNEVPGPHSRKISTLVKNRLQTIAFKLVQKHPKNRIKVHRLTRYFPDQSDLQMRQRLKEFMEFNRKGDNQGFWMVKRTVSIPDDAEMLKMATPEMVCLSESTQVGLRHLQDAGYGQAEEGGAGDDDSKLDIEQQLAPWITTKNFINANANKAMLKLHGDGDPTGRGEAFSFLRVSMKDIFLRAGEKLEDRLKEMDSRPKSAHRYNVQEQQVVYKEEIKRIWKAQADSLSNPIEPDLTQADEDRASGRQRRGGSMIAETPQSLAGTPRDLWGGGYVGTPGSRASSPDKDDVMSVASGRGGMGGHKILRIKRLVNGVWETETVKDPAIIKSYVKQRQTIDDERTDADDLLPSDDEGKNERRKKRLKEQLEKLKRNQERRLARKNQKLGIAPGAVGVGGKRTVKPETTRICGNCGQRGHMKTSKRLCPRWAEFNAPKESAQSGILPSSFGGGLALPGLGGVASAPAPTPAPAPAPVPPKPTLKFKLGSAMSPPPEQ